MARINLKRFEKQLTVRPLRPEDFDGVRALQQRCFPGMEGTTRAQFDSQLANFAEGQLGIEYQGRLVASSSSVILDFELYKDWSSWEEIADGGFIRNHKPQGTTLYGIELMVDPELQGKRLARRLYDARKALAREKNLMRIVIAGRIPGYRAHGGAMTPREYIDRVITKELFDPVLTAQLANGFVLKRIIPGYLNDPSSGGYAAFLEWTNVDYVPDPKRRFVSVAPVRVCVVQYQLRPISTFEQFARQCEYFVDVAADYKSDFILFPEIFTTQLLSLLPNSDAASAMRRLDEFTPRYLELFTDLAVRYNVNVIGGSHFTVEDGSLYNIAYLFRRDGTLGKQYKLHITPTERHWWGVQPGNRVEVFDTDRGRISIQICYDVEFPEVSRVAVEKGAQMIFVPFCTDERYGYLRVRYCAQARCVENQVYTAIAGSVGNLPHVPALGLHYAQSGVFTPSDIPFKRDAIAAEATPNIETVIFEDLDLELLKRNRQSGTVLNWNDRRTDVFEFKYAPPPEASVAVPVPPRLSELVPVEAIALDAGVSDRPGVLRALSQLLHTELVDAGTIERLLAEREALSTTAVGHGVALPHCRLEGASRIRVAILCAREPVDFGASDGERVKVFVGVTSPPTGGAHLAVLSRLATAFRREEVRTALGQAQSPGDVLRLLETVDEPARRKEPPYGAQVVKGGNGA
jgi:predicted amidohydrolase/mannitol/fructose-specific phosphotransferase system IIA component (Ntr-type)/GNAT superfamily N-acetyltransferase